MDKAILQRITLPVTATLREAMEAFSFGAPYTNGSGFAVVTDGNGRCIAVVTDGDVRRCLLRDCTLETPVAAAMNRCFTHSRISDSTHQILRLFDRRVRVVPVLDDEDRLVRVIQYSDFKAAARIDKWIIRARAPVRVSFAGGGTDTSYFIRSQTGVVLSSTINRYAYATVTVRADRCVRIVSRDYRQTVEAECISDLTYDGQLDLIKACARLMDPPFGFELETYSEVEPGTGLGGSSAIAVAVIGVLNHFRNDNHLDRYAIADLAYQAERIELGIPGGWQDQYASVFGGLSVIEFRQSEILVFPMAIPRQLLLELKYNLLLFRCGQPRSSGSIHQDQRRQFDTAGVALEEYYSALAALAVRMKEAVARGNLLDFGDLLHEGWEAKKKLADGITNVEIDHLYDAARQSGALGGKLLGAGSGGYLLLFCPPSRQLSVVETLQSMGAQPERFDFVETGLQTWKARP